MGVHQAIAVQYQIIATLDAVSDTLQISLQKFILKLSFPYCEIRNFYFAWLTESNNHFTFVDKCIVQNNII